MKEFYLKPKFFSAIKSYSGSQFAKDLVVAIAVGMVLHLVFKFVFKNK